MRTASLFQASLAALAWLLPTQPVQAQDVLLEAESFEEHGGWLLDTQFIDLMGSPYMLAHGLGKPVADATTTVRFSFRGPHGHLLVSVQGLGKLDLLM